MNYFVYKRLCEYGFINFVVIVFAIVYDVDYGVRFLFYFLFGGEFYDLCYCFYVIIVNVKYWNFYVFSYIGVVSV